MKLPKEYYFNPDVVALAKDLLGKELVCHTTDGLCSGLISETEAYKGTTDKASHAFGGKITSRNHVMYKQGGIAYVYLCYGMHCLFNVVSNVESIPDAVLIRGIIPMKGIEMMKVRIHSKSKTVDGHGPGKLSKLLGISLMHNNIALDSEDLFIRNAGIVLSDENILAAPRIGVDYAGEDAALPYRFTINKKYHESLLSSYHSQNR